MLWCLKSIKIGTFEFEISPNLYFATQNPVFHSVHKQGQYGPCSMPGHILPVPGVDITALTPSTYSIGYTAAIFRILLQSCQPPYQTNTPACLYLQQIW